MNGKVGKTSGFGMDRSGVVRIRIKLRDINNRNVSPRALPKHLCEYCGYRQAKRTFCDLEATAALEALEPIQLGMVDGVAYRSSLPRWFERGSGICRASSIATLSRKVGYARRPIRRAGKPESGSWMEH